MSTGLALLATPSGPEIKGVHTAKEEMTTILVADDDRLIVATLGRGLRAAGFHVIEAFDSNSALELCIENTPSLAIIDYNMPGSNGVELARLIADRTSVPMIFLSAYSDAPIVREAIAAGVMTYLVKPIDIGQLLPVARSAMQRALELQKLRAELKSARDRHRVVSIATGLLMSRFHISQKDAFERLRRHARSTRARIEDVAAPLVQATEETTRLYETLSGRSTHTAHDGGKQ